MPNQEHSQYVFDLQEVDVLCGRGSGPNDRAGNIEFRNLILTRKAEYLAAKTREAKGRIASDIVNNVRARGGRFLKKLSPAQVKEAGFKRGMAVYEFADEPTVLEKAKQTLRQNRAAFEKAHVDESEDGVNGNRGSYGGTGNMDSNYHNMAPPAPVSNYYSGGSGSGESVNINPIPLSQASHILDSDKLPPLGSSETRHLQHTLFASSSISSKEMHGGKIEGLIHAAESLSSAPPQMNYNNQQVDYNGVRNSSSISSKDLPCYNRPSDQVNLSMDMSLLLNSNNNGSYNMSTNSAERFGSLINEFNSADQASLMKQYESLQEKHQQALLQQYEIMKRKHEQMVQSMYSPTNSNDMNFNMQQNYPPQCTNNNQIPLPQSNQWHMTDAERKYMQSFAEDSLSRHNNERRNSDGFSSDVFRSLMREYSVDPAETNQYQNTPNPQYQNSQYQNNQYQNNQYQNAQDMSRTSNESHLNSITTSHLSTVSDFSQLSKDPVITEAFGTMARQQDFNDQQKLLQQFEMLQGQQCMPSQPVNDGVVIPTQEFNDQQKLYRQFQMQQGHQPCGISSTQPIYENHPIDRDYHIGTNDDGIVKPAPPPQNLTKRPSRRPRNDETEQSLTLGAVFGKNIESNLKEDTMNSSGSSMNTPSSQSRKGPQAPRDSSLLSLMSMSVSLSEISHDLVSPKNPSGNPGGGSNARPAAAAATTECMNEASAATERTGQSNDIDKLKDMSCMSLGDSWALDDC